MLSLSLSLALLPEIIKFNVLGVDPGSEYKAFGVEGGDGPARQVHQPVAVVRLQVPQPDRFVHRA